MKRLLFTLLLALSFNVNAETGTWNGFFVVGVEDGVELWVCAYEGDTTHKIQWYYMENVCDFTMDFY